MVTYRTRKCPVCATVFQTKAQSKQYYCTQKCKEAAKK